MSLLSRDKLRLALKEGSIAPLYVLFGPEDYLRGRAVRAITDASLRDAPLREFNEASYSLLTSGIDDAIAAAEQLPMMAQRRVVRVTDFAKLSEGDDEVLLRYLARPAESTVLIFIADDLDKRLKMTRALIESCCAVEFPRLFNPELSQWARMRVKELKIDIDGRSLNYLLALVGNEIRRLDSELEKLATASIGNGSVTVEMIDSLVSHSRELSNFELTDHMVARNRKQSLQTLKRLMDDGSEPLMLLGVISSNYHRLALAKALIAKGASNEEVFRTVGMPFKKRREFLELARRTHADSLVQSIKRIAAADLAIKTSLATPRMQLELLVCELSAN